jgi:hypothetical protein
MYIQHRPKDIIQQKERNEVMTGYCCLMLLVVLKDILRSMKQMNKAEDTPQAAIIQSIDIHTIYFHGITAIAMKL